MNVPQFELEPGGFLGEAGKMVPDQRGEYVRTEDYAKLESINRDLLATIKHFVHWHDQLSKADIARAEAVIAKAEART